MALVLGLNAKLYYKVGGVGAGGSWLELTNVKDVTLGLEKSEADVTTRASGGWRSQVGTLRDAPVSWSMLWDDGDTGFNVIKDTYLASPGVIGLRIYDKVSGNGLEADFDIFGFTRNEQLTDALTVDVTAKITHSPTATAPVWNVAS